MCEAYKSYLIKMKITISMELFLDIIKEKLNFLKIEYYH